ncbi:hypothetical protein AGIG_G4205 [Arapaima gigas]
MSTPLIPEEQTGVAFVQIFCQETLRRTVSCPLSFCVLGIRVRSVCGQPSCHVCSQSASRPLMHTRGEALYCSPLPLVARPCNYCTAPPLPLVARPCNYCTAPPLPLVARPCTTVLCLPAPPCGQTL